MIKKRLIPVLLLKNGWLVQSKGFVNFQNLGNPTTAVKRLSEWAADELIYLDISSSDIYNIRRNDQGYPNRKTFLEIISDVSKYAFMPITVGGKIRKLEKINKFLKNGADKIAINKITRIKPKFVMEAAKEFGSQCIIVSVDYKKNNGNYFVFNHEEKKSTNLKLLDWVKKMQEYGAGEILLNSVDHDGMKDGYDLDLINTVSEKISIPIIACGGAGDWNDFYKLLSQTNVAAAAAANIFHFKDQSVYLAKKYLYDKGVNVRKPTLMDI